MISSKVLQNDGLSSVNYRNHEDGPYCLTIPSISLLRWDAEVGEGRNTYTHVHSTGRKLQIQSVSVECPVRSFAKI
jgi:hypothetical protein